MVRGHRTACLSILLSLLFCVSFLAAGAPTVEARIGFASAVVPRLYAPVRITVSGLEETIAGSLRIVQYVGVLSEDPAEVTIELTSGTIENQTYETSIPIYDPLNPIEIVLRDGAGATLVAQELNFRLFMRSAPFPLVCESAVDLGGSEIRVGVNELPWEWWAYEAVDSLWLGGIQTQRPATDAITRWILSGGSLVLFSGSDFYKYDPIFLKDVFPVAEPTLEVAADGATFIAGRPPDDAEMALQRDDGTPLLYTRSLGAGSVAFVSMRAEELSEDELRMIASRVRPAQLLSMASASTTLHGEIRVPRPNFLIAPLIVIAMIVALAVSWRLRTRGLRTDEPARRSAVAVVVGVAMIASVFSGFYTNRTKQLVELYQCNTILDVQASVGCRILSHTLFAPGYPLDAEMSRVRESVPAYPLIRTARRAVFDSSATPDGLVLSLAAGESRQLRAYADSRGILDLRIEGDGALIENRLETPLTAAYVIHEGALYRIDKVPAGSTTSVRLEGGLRVWSLRGIDMFRYSDALKVVESAFRFRSGSWLIAVVDETSIRSGVQTEEKVRDAHFYVVQGDLG